MVAGIRKGEEKVYRELFRTYYRPLVVFAMDYVHDLDSAREIVQVLFVHLYERREKLEIRSSLRSYLYRSVRNRCLNHMSGKESRNIPLEAHIDTPSPGDTIEEEIQGKEMEHRIFRAVESLPPKCREVFIMSRVKGLDNTTIAAHLQISKRTVETQISKALRLLREKIY